VAPSFRGATVIFMTSPDPLVTVMTSPSTPSSRCVTSATSSSRIAVVLPDV
jgi:hypothetical protein